MVYSQNFDSISVGVLPTGWSAISGSNWSVTDTHSISSPNGLIGPLTAGDGATILYTGFGTLTDMDVRYDVGVVQGFIGVILRAAADISSCYIIIADTPNNLNGTWKVYVKSGGRAYSNIGSYNATGLSGNISVRARIKGSTIYLKLWNQGVSEPASWSYTLTDSTVNIPGYSGFYNQFNGSVGGSVVDNYILDDTTTAILTAGISNSSAITSTTATVNNNGASGGTSPYSYQWYRSTISGFTPSSGNIVAGATSLNLNDTGISPSTTYYYINVATDSTGATANSSQISLTTASVSLANISNTIPVNNSSLFWSPGNWDHLTSATFGVSVDTMQATAAGAYLKFQVTGTVNLSVGIDNATTNGFPSGEMPIVRYSINGASWTDIQLVPSQTSLVLSSSLSPGSVYGVEIYLKSSSSTSGYADVWGSNGVSPSNVMRINGLTLDSTGSISAATLRSRRSFHFGDSMLAGEHCNLDGSDDSTQSWAPLMAQALNCEYGQIGYGGQGWEVTGGSNAAPFNTAYEFYSAGRPRSGFSELDYIFIHHGSNDARSSIGGSSIQSDCNTMLTNLRALCGARTIIFIFVPPQGSYAANLAAAVTSYKMASGDTKVFCIDATSQFPSTAFTLTFGGLTEWTYDGVHPLIYGHARLAAAYSAKAISSTSTTTTPTIQSHQLKRARS
jgi:hypothetical protein